MGYVLIRDMSVGVATQISVGVWGVRWVRVLELVEGLGIRHVVGGEVKEVLRVAMRSKGEVHICGCLFGFFRLPVCWERRVSSPVRGLTESVFLSNGYFSEGVDKIIEVFFL